ncbi:MAG TPA: PDZ domain-containing protein [Longimicrobiales bacterium]
MVQAMDWTDARVSGATARVGRGRPAVRRVALMGAALLLAAAPASAQEGEREGTRENCWCVSMPARVQVLSFGQRARMGVMLATKAGAEDAALGARIERVLEDSPAEEAGLRAGDIITAIDGRSVLEPLPDEDIDEDESPPAARVSMIMRDVEPGDTIRVDYLRDGERRTADVVTRDVLEIRAPWTHEDLERMQARMRELRDALPRRVDAFAFGWGADARFGIHVADLDPDLGEYFGTTEGVLVVRVDEDSPFELRAGDVIQRVGGRKVEDAAHLRQILASYRENETVQLEVLRKQERLMVEGQAP